MRNFAVKFALLGVHRTDDAGGKPDIQAYIDREPLEMLLHYKSLLSLEERGAFLFAFSDAALLAILDNEFDVDPDRNLLLFRKTALDAQSIRLAGLGPEGEEGFPLSGRETALLEHVSIRLLELTRGLYRDDLREERVEGIRQEYEESIRSYVRRRLNYPLGGNGNGAGAGGTELILRSLLVSEKSLRAFCHALTADAIFKADAAARLFGVGSAYAQAWQRKQMFRHMMASNLGRMDDSIHAQRLSHVIGTREFPVVYETDASPDATASTGAPGRAKTTPPVRRHSYE